jgi:hypothetical protein
MTLTQFIIGAPLVLGVILFAVFIVYPRFRSKDHK